MNTPVLPTVCSSIGQVSLQPRFPPFLQKNNISNWSQFDPESEGHRFASLFKIKRLLSLNNVHSIFIHSTIQNIQVELMQLTFIPFLFVMINHNTLFYQLCVKVIVEVWIVVFDTCRLRIINSRGTVLFKGPAHRGWNKEIMSLNDWCTEHVP